jgi:hypothetical protein
MTRQEFRIKWEARRDEWSRRGISAPAGPLLDEVLADLDSVARDEGTELLNLTQAALRSGYSPDSLGRMVRSGKLANLGRKNAPLVRAADLPRKPLRFPARSPQFRPTSRQMARTSTMTPKGGK